MKRTIILLPVATLATLTLAGAIVFSAPAEAHNGVDHEAERLDTMHKLLTLLQQVAELLSKHAEQRGIHIEVANDHDEMVVEGSLSVSVEEHSGRTHIHVYEPGKDEVSFFLDNLQISDHDAIIAAISHETGLSEIAVEGAVTFPAMEEDEHEEGDEHEDHDDEMDLEGIHIMSDGTVMLGNGTALDDATINEDGMIVLSDGSIVEPEADLR